MIQQQTLRFLRQLKMNNDKAWMDAHRADYLQAKDNVESLGTQLIAAIARFDPSIAGLSAKDCTFRINRDIRFSANKSPYKTNMALYLSQGGKKSIFAGYYCHIEPGQSFFAGGIWMPMPAILQKIRQEIDYCWDEFESIIQQKAFKKIFGDLERSDGQVLSRPPKGYEINNPAIEYLKLKSFIAQTPLKDGALMQPGLVNDLAAIAKAMHPLILFLNRAVGDEAE